MHALFFSVSRSTSFKLVKIEVVENEMEGAALLFLQLGNEIDNHRLAHTEAWVFGLTSPGTLMWLKLKNVAERGGKQPHRVSEPD